MGLFKNPRVNPIDFGLTVEDVMADLDPGWLIWRLQLTAGQDSNCQHLHEGALDLAGNGDGIESSPASIRVA